MNATSGKAVVALVIAALALAGLLVGTGAVDSVGGIGDALFGENEPQIVMAPHDGPNGQFVVESENGELEVDFTDPGLTRDAQLQFHRVFDLVNEDDETVVVWVTHGNADTIRLYDHDTGRTLSGEANAVSLDPGERVVVSVDVDSRGVTVNDLVTTVTFAAQFDAPFFELDIIDIDDTVAAGQTVTVESEVTNVGTVAGEQEVRLLVDGEVVDSTTVSIDGEGTETVEFAYETDASDIGNRTVAVETDDDSDEREVVVEPAAGSFFDVTIDEIADAIDVGERLTVEATVENVGGAPETQSIELVVDGEVVDERTVELGGPNASTETIELNWTPQEGDEGTDVPIVVRSADDEETAEIDVNAAFVAQASANSYAVSVGSSVELRAERSITPPGVTPTFSWELDGEPLGEGETLSTELSEPGDREITLTMTDGDRTDTDTITINVDDATPPTASLDAETGVGPGESVRFDASGSSDNVDIESYEWDFGDGTTGEGERPTHTYDEPGRYTVTVTVVDTSGNEATATERIVVESPRGTLSSDELDFGEVGTGSSSVTTVEVENTGTTPLEMENIRITGSDSFDLIGDAGDGELTVAPGDTRSIDVAFSPTADGTESATLDFESNDPNELGPVSLTGVGIEGDLEPIDSTVEFGDVSVSDREQRTVTVENVGNDAVEITDAGLTGPDANDFDIVDGGAATIEPGETHDLTVAFEPTVGGDRRANLRVVSADSTVTVALRGTGAAPQMRLSPTEVTFSTIGVGDRTRTTVDVRNVGVETLKIDEAIIGGADPDQFRVADETVPETVAPGETESFELWFDPDVDGDHSASLTVGSNDPRPAQEIPITGSAVGAEIGIDRETLDFGKTELDETVFLDITVRNREDSPADLTIEESEIVSGDTDVFFIESGGGPTTLAPGESEIITVGFTPDQIGPQSAQMRIFSDAGNRPVINVWLSNTRSYILVRETENVNIEGYNLVDGDSHDVNVSTPRGEGEAAEFQELNFTNARGGNFEMDISHGNRPFGPSFDAVGESAAQYVELDHRETDPDSTFTGTGIRYRVSKATVPADAGPDDVALYRWNEDAGEWTDLRDRAELVEETPRHYVYEIETPGFSQFVTAVPAQDDTGGGTTPPGDGTGGGSSGPSGDEGGSSSEDGESSIRTDVEFGGDDSEFSTRTVSRDEIIELDEAMTDEPPRALIHPRRGEPLDADRTVTIDGEQRTLSANRTRVMLANEPAVLSGERSTISSGEAITSRDRMVGAIEINVPANRRNDPATVRFSMDRGRFGDSDPESATIGHLTDDGWELLSTEVGESTDEEVVLTAETPGFSVFAVFADPQVQYEWTLPDGSTARGPVLNHTFAEPGLYEVELTVSDAFGRVSTTTYQVLANDVPEATIEVVEREGETTTLAADVGNEIGDTNVTWTFPDGTEATGTEVTQELADGEHEITLHVIDEYGAESETQETIAVGPAWAAVGAAADSLNVSLEFMLQLSMVALVGGAIALGYRRFPWRVFASTRRRRPEITVFESPTANTAVGRFVIEAFEVESGGSDLEAITIEAIDDDDRTVIQKRIDASGMQTYTASPETLIAPPGAGFDREGRYTIRVKASDESGRSVKRHASVATAESDDESIDNG